ncbi:hypothetical protein F4823DRAFT_497356 [Ustulina deusta]|nr:hypothetical protein F4823DRAFT_497356 [Ustulina deusta]
MVVIVGRTRHFRVCHSELMLDLAKLGVYRSKPTCCCLYAYFFWWAVTTGCLQLVFVLIHRSLRRAVKEPSWDDLAMQGIRLGTPAASRIPHHDQAWSHPPASLSSLTASATTNRLIELLCYTYFGYRLSKQPNRHRDGIWNFGHAPCYTHSI